MKKMIFALVLMVAAQAAAYDVQMKRDTILPVDLEVEIEKAISEKCYILSDLKEVMTIELERKYVDQVGGPADITYQTTISGTRTEEQYNKEPISITILSTEKAVNGVTFEAGPITYSSPGACFTK